METNTFKQLKKDLSKQRRRLEDAKARRHYATISDAEFRIRLLEAQIEEEKKYQPNPISELLTPEQIAKHGIVQKIIEMHLAADFLADSAMVLRETLEGLGLNGCSLFKYTAEIKHNSEYFASLLCAYQSLQDFICDDGEYIEAAHNLTNAYITKHLKII